jgi:SNF2 family DNA or RNA helicase
MLFGTIEFKKGRRGGAGTWTIECEGHVRNRLKRFFPAIKSWATTGLELTNNPENCRDLMWFLERYPMNVPDIERMRTGAEFHVSMEQKIAAILSASRPPDDFELALAPREYQKVAATLCEAKTGLLVGDKVGLGKSVTAMCPMTRKVNLPALVVTLPHLQIQWRDYLAKFAPQLKVHILKVGTPYDLTKPPRRKKSDTSPVEPPRLPDVIICNYHKLSGWAEELKSIIRYVVYDECQELRRNESNKYAAAKEIADAAALRMGLSATPIYNYGNEFYNVIDVLLPDSLGTRDEFTREWCADQSIKDPKAFGDYLRREGLMLVRTRKDVGRELPPVNKLIQPIEVDLNALNRVKGTAIDLAKTILAANQTFRNEKFQASSEFNVLLRQATGVAKAPHVAEFVRMLLETEEKVILFGWHHEVYAIWQEALKEFKPVMYTGKESSVQKEASKKAFIEGDSRVMIISLRAGAGLDGLQEVCRTLVIGEFDWSPGVHEQNIGRLARDPESGILDSLGPVFAYFMLAEDGSDPVMADVLGLKRAQIDGVRNEHQELVEELSVDPNHIKTLAAAYLAKLGVSLPPPEVAEFESLEECALL